MKKILGLLAILIPLAASAAQPRSVALVIQENGNVQVSETQDLEPAGPDGLVRISPLPETLLPASVNAVCSRFWALLLKSSGIECAAP